MHIDRRKATPAPRGPAAAIGTGYKYFRQLLAHLVRCELVNVT
jgi:hypothetical protein